MGLKDKWQDKVNNVDYIVAEDINNIANSIIELEDKIEGGDSSAVLLVTAQQNTSTYEWTFDKTFAEITEATKKGTAILQVTHDSVMEYYYSSLVEPTAITFCSYDVDGEQIFQSLFIIDSANEVYQQTAASGAGVKIIDIISNDGYTSETTWQELIDSVNANKYIVARFSDMMFPLSAVSPNDVNMTFQAVSNGNLVCFEAKQGTAGSIAFTLTQTRVIPQKGVDYWTEADKQEINNYIADELAKRGQLKPEFANNIEELQESGDTSKLYVLPDGYIYAYMKSEVTAPSEPLFTNQIPISTDSSGAVYNNKGYKENTRISSSGTEKEAAGYFCTGFIPARQNDIIRIKNATISDANRYNTMIAYTSAYAAISGTVYLDTAEAIDDVYQISVTQTSSAIQYIRLTLKDVSADSIVTVNEAISYSSGGSQVIEMWQNTNILFVPSTEATTTIVKDILNLPISINVLRHATETNRTTIYGEKGYKNGIRLSSSGAEVEGAATSITGFIAATANDVLRFKGIRPISGVLVRISAYNSANEQTGTITYSFNSSATIENNGFTCVDVIGKGEDEDYLFTVPLSETRFGSGWNAIRFSAGTISDNTIVTINEEIQGSIYEVIDDHSKRIAQLERGGSGDTSEKSAIERLKQWKYPIVDIDDVFLLSEQKPALDKSWENTATIYAKYDELMGNNPLYITKEDLGLASDNSTHIYAYRFKESDPHHLRAEWSETKPTLLICSGVHPTEQTGVWSLYYALAEIAQNEALQEIRRNLEIVVTPMINPTAFSDTTYGVRNPEGIQVHYNFEVDFNYPGTSGYVEEGNRNYGGEIPLSIPETQYFDKLMQKYQSTLALVLSCHNNDYDEQYGTGFVWASSATHYLCNLGFRLIDKLSAAWHAKYGTTFEEGVRWANDYALTKKDEGSATWAYAVEQEEGDWRAGRASLSGSGGTEYKQSLKYGVHGVNIEVCDRCMILDKNAALKRTANVMTWGTETYINFLKTFMKIYDPKNKKDYAPNLPWSDL